MGGVDWGARAIVEHPLCQKIKHQAWQCRLQQHCYEATKFSLLLSVKKDYTDHRKPRQIGLTSQNVNVHEAESVHESPLCLSGVSDCQTQACLCWWSTCSLAGTRSSILQAAAAALDRSLSFTILSLQERSVKFTARLNMGGGRTNNQTVWL